MQITLENQANIPKGEIVKNKLNYVKSRRRFIQLLGATGGALAAAQLLGSSPVSAQETSTEQEQVNQNSNSYSNTFIESTVLNAGWIGVRKITDKLKIPLGNAGYEGVKAKRAFYDKSVKRIIYENGVLAPILEEGLFRWLPSWRLDASGREDTAWDFGLPISLGFAAMHNLTFDEHTKKLGFALNRIPLGQFLMGNYFWKTMRERGISHAILAHATANLEQVLAAKAYQKLFPDKIEAGLQKLEQQEILQEFKP